MLHHFGRAETNIQPTYIGSNNVRTASSTATVTSIANVQAGDLLIAFAFNTNQAALITIGDGWTLRATNTGTANIWFLFTKVATAAETNYLFNSTTGTVGIIVLAYRGCEPCQVQVGTTTFASTTTQTGTSITTSNQGTLLFYSYSETTSGTITTAPAGMTQRNLLSTTSLVASVYELANVSQGTVTGNKTIVYSAANAGAGVLVQIKTAQRQVITPQYIAQANANSAAVTVTVNKPTGTQENDIMIAALRSGTNTTGVTWSLTGWTAAYNGSGFAVLYRVAGASEGASYTFTASSGTAAQGCIATFRYCSYDTIGTVISGTSPSNPAVTTTLQYDLGITVGGRQAATTYTPPAGMITIHDGSGSAGAIIMSYLDPIGNGTFTGTNTANTTSNLAAISLALKGLVTS